MSPNIVPASNNHTPTSPNILLAKKKSHTNNIVPATKSDAPTSPSNAPATKITFQNHQMLPLPRKMTRQHHQILRDTKSEAPSSPNIAPATMLQHHQTLCLPRIMTIQHHQIFHLLHDQGIVPCSNEKKRSSIERVAGIRWRIPLGITHHGPNWSMPEVTRGRPERRFS